jgi:RNA-directed DNA polymerase
MNVFVNGMLFIGISGIAWWAGRIVARQIKQTRRKILTLDDLATRLDVPIEELIQHQPRYSIAHIPKRSGGTRTLHIPDPQTKHLQRRMLRRLFAGLKSHSAAIGFEAGLSIVDAARPHVGQAVVIRLDVVDFFATTTVQRVADYFRSIGWDEQAAQLLVRLTTHAGGLPQGAPTSPRLSNLVNSLLDAQLAGFARTRRGQYTRYADDLTLSFRRISGKRIRGAIKQIGRILAGHGYQLHLDRKLHIRRRHQQQKVLGLVVNSGVRLSRKNRRWLRAVRHRHRTTGKCSLTQNQLDGWTAFEHMIESQR